MFGAIWCHLYNFKNVKNTHGGVLLLLKKACNLTKELDAPPELKLANLRPGKDLLHIYLETKVDLSLTTSLNPRVRPKNRLVRQRFSP